MGAVVEITSNEFAEKGVSVGMRKMITVALTKIAAQAKALCPVDYGQLRNSISYKLEEKTALFNQGGAGTSAIKRVGTGRSGSAPSEHMISLDTPIFGIGKTIYGYVGTNSDHWYPEFGTRWMAAQPFLRPAKELIMDGGKAAAIGKKYGTEAMAAEFQKRKIEFERLAG